MFNWEKFFAHLQQDVKLFLFIFGVISLFRIGFIAILHPYLGEWVTSGDIAVALRYGAKISLKSAGLLTFVSFSLCMLAHVFTSADSHRLRFYIGSAYVCLLSFLFHVRIPYYEQFHIGFNQLLFNTFQDDTYALAATIWQQYNLPVRFGLVLVTAAVLVWLLRVCLNSRIVQLPRLNRWYQNAAVRVIVLVAIYYVSIFVRFGGSMTYAYNVDWENSGVTKDQLLNEAILDDMQALYRAYQLHGRWSNSTGIDIDVARMKEYGSYLAGRQMDSDSLDAYLKKSAQGAAAKEPKQVFLIISESYANWPLLPQYQDLHIADGVRALISRPDSAYVPTFLPNGLSTISAVLGVVSGFADVNLYLNAMPEAYQEPFPTAIAPQMKRLGYRANFWYAGPSSWERVKDFTLAQGFDVFYGLGDYETRAGSVWGCDDKYVFDAVLSRTDSEQPSFNVILSVSNHAPYTVDLAAEGFDPAKVAAALPPNLRDNQELIKQLGHFWYGDKMLSQFVERARQKYPDSLFLIVGDHADRLNLETNPGMYKRYGIPFIVSGKGITNDSLSPRAAGSHINVAPTLFELVAPKGFVYYSLGGSLTRDNRFGMNCGFWITRDYIGDDDSDSAEGIAGGEEKPSKEEIEMNINSIRAASWWRIKNGERLLVK